VRPATLIADLEARGVRLAVLGQTLRVDAPKGILTPADREALAQHKPAVLAALRAGASRATTATDDSWADGMPDGPCVLCGHQRFADVRDWPVPGAARWLCLACAAQPVPNLADMHAGLTDAEQQRLRTEAHDGDPLARLLLGLIAEGTA
jgi:hypothetical protein